MLTEDATFSMPPNVAWFRGRDAIEAFLPTGPMSLPRRFRPVRADRQLAFGTYIWEPGLGHFRPNAIHLIDLDGERIRDIVAFLDRSVFPAFGRPAPLPPSRPPPPTPAPRAGSSRCPPPPRRATRSCRGIVAARARCSWSG